MLTLDALGQTALIPFWARVSDSHQVSPILGDSAAASIADAVEQHLGRIEVDESTRAGCCLRNRFADLWLARLVTPDATVVDVGVGLDTRLLRQRPNVARYIEVDSAEVIALRDELLPGTGAVRVAGDGLNVRDWAGSLPLGNRTTTVVLEGVLAYHKPERVHWFFAELASILPGAFIIFDSMSPLSAWMANRPTSRLSGRPDYLWAPWSTRSIPVDAQRLKVIAERGFMDFSRQHTQAFGFAYRLPVLRRSYRLTVAQLPACVP